MTAPERLPDRLPDRLQDDRVVLRGIVERDAEALFGHLSSDPDIARWTRIPWPYTRGHLRDFMALVGRARLGSTDLVLAITEPDADTLVGSVGVHRMGGAEHPRSALLANEVGYWLAREARGRGLVTSAVRLVSACALRDLGVSTLNLQTKVGNTASQNVARRAGYHFVRRVPASEVDDDLSDHDRFEMTRADYERAHGPLDTASVTGAAGSGDGATTTPTTTGRRSGA